MTHGKNIPYAMEELAHHGQTTGQKKPVVPQNKEGFHQKRNTYITFFPTRHMLKYILQRANNVSRDKRREQRTLS